MRASARRSRRRRQLDEAPRPPDRPPLGPVVLPLHADAPLQEAMHEASDCRRCHLYEPATQTVFGEGPAHAERAVRRRAAGRPGGRDRPAVRRAGRPDHGSRDGGGRHRPAHRLHHQCGEALQVRAARQAAHPQDARGARDPGLPLLARRRAGAAAAEAGGGDGRHRGARRARAARSPSRASAGGRSRCPTARRRSSPCTRLSCCGCPTKTRRRGSTAPSSPICEKVAGAGRARRRPREPARPRGPAGSRRPR